MFNAHALLSSLSRLESDIRAVSTQTLGQAASFAKERAMQTTKWKDRTGKLRGSIQRQTRSSTALRVLANTKYAAAVEYGSKAHIIRGKGGGLLRFVIAGAVIFRRSVRHPGTRATHFMLDARNEAEEKLESFIHAGLNRLL